MISQLYSRPIIPQNAHHHYMNNNNNLSYNNRNGYNYEEKKWIQDMFSQINMSVNQLLQNLNYIYESHGVQYDVRIFAQAIIRLLAPVQLLSQIRNKVMNQRRDNNGWENNFNKNMSQNQFINSNNYPPKFQNIDKFSNSKMGLRPLNMNTSNQHMSPPKNPNYLPKQQQSLYEDDTRLNYQNSLNCIGSRTSLNPQQQQQICSWLKQRFQAGKPITKSIIMRQAKKISRNPTFLASSGWCRRFLIRNEDARMFVQMNRFAPQIHMQKIQNARQQRRKREQKLKLKLQQQQNKQKQKLAQNSQNKYWDPVYQDQPFQQIVRNSQQQQEDENKVDVYEESESNQQFQQKHDKNVNQNNDQKSQNSSNSPKFQQVVNKLQSAVKDHKDSMIYPINTNDKQTDRIKQNLIKKLNESTAKFLKDKKNEG